MGRNEFANLGDEIKDAVQSAINKGDFAKLRAEIGDSVNQAFDEIKQSLQGTWNDSNVKQPGSKQNEKHQDLFVLSGICFQVLQKRAAAHRGSLSFFAFGRVVHMVF